MKKQILLILLTSISTFAQSPVFDLNKKLGRGINMGNMFEAPTETEWGNQFKDDYFQRIAGLGFNHVRIPIRWDTPTRTQSSEPYTINTVFLDRIKYVVDKALAEKLYVVINMHHHNEVFNTPDAQKPKLLSQWKQIAAFFKDYDSRLVFEVLNEPNTNLTADKWNVLFAEALTEIRKTNPSRAVMMGTANWGGVGGVSLLKIPQDANLILTVHYYDPFQFTHQGADWVGTDALKWLGTKWENTSSERDEIAQQFQYLINYSKQNNIPVHIGEFGAYSKADLESRVKWTNFLARWFEEKGFSWAYWEFSAGFGIYDPSKNQYLTPLVDALLKNPMPTATELNTKKIFESKFDAGDNEWSLSVLDKAKATWSKANGTAAIDVSLISTESWHVQFIKSNVSLQKGKRYLVSFEASANADTPVSNYLGKASNPYNAYSGYKGYTFTKESQKFSYSFVMAENDDPQARIVFDLGLKAANVNIKNFILQEETSSQAIALSKELENLQVLIYPNPVRDVFTIKGLSSFQEISIINLKGQEIFRTALSGENERSVRLTNNADKILFIILSNQKGRIAKKVLVE